MGANPTPQPTPPPDPKQRGIENGLHTFELGPCPMCSFPGATIQAHRLEETNKTRIVIVCNSCDLYPDEVSLTCWHGTFEPSDECGSECATAINYIKSLAKVEREAKGLR